MVDELKLLKYQFEANTKTTLNIIKDLNIRINRLEDKIATIREEVDNLNYELKNGANNPHT